MIEERPTLQECQAFHRWLDEQKGFSNDLPANVMLLVEEVGEVAKAVRSYLKGGRLGDSQEQELARDHLREELADCLAYIAKLANYTDIDLERAYVEKMRYNMTRVWD